MAPTATMAMLLLACVCWPVAGDAPMAMVLACAVSHRLPYQYVAIRDTVRYESGRVSAPSRATFFKYPVGVIRCCVGWCRLCRGCVGWLDCLGLAAGADDGDAAADPPMA